MDLLTRIRDRSEAMADGARGRARLAAGGRHGPGWLGALTLGALGAGAGAVAAMLLDPIRGRSRRARLADQSAAVLRRAGRDLERETRRVGAAVEGRMAALRAAGGHGGEDPGNDATIADRVQSELFADPSVPKGDLNVNVEHGIVVLRGEVPDDAMRRQLVERVERMDGVWSVRDLMHLPGETAPTDVHSLAR